MPENIETPQYRRIELRRALDRDREVFSSCPKFHEHDLSNEQMKELIEEIAEVLLAKVDSPERRKELLKEIYKDMKADAFDEGKGAIYKVVVSIGFIAMVTYGWLSNHPIKL